MKNNDIIKYRDTIYRVIDITGDKIFVVDCNKKSTPKWIDIAQLSSSSCTDKLEELPDINDMGLLARKTAYERFSLISGILPFVTDKAKRTQIINELAMFKGVSKQTINNYLWLYLVHQNISALAPKEKEDKKELSVDEKNIRWALNKYFYTQRKNTLKTAYTYMLKEKYCDDEGRLVKDYPTFNQFRYFYRKHKKMQNLYISRNGLTNYQRNQRPLLGNGIQEFASSIGVGMLDATVQQGW